LIARRSRVKGKGTAAYTAAQKATVKSSQKAKKVVCNAMRCQTPAAQPKKAEHSRAAKVSAHFCSLALATHARSIHPLKKVKRKIEIGAK